MPHFAPALACALLATAAAAQERQPANIAVWRNTLGMAFVHIPAGSFAMGSAEDPEVLARDYPLLERQRFELLADEAVEAVYVPLPNSMHLPWSERALEAGCVSLAEPKDKPQGQRVAYVRDPFGGLVELATPL